MGWEVGGFSTHSFTRSHFPICLLVFLSFLFLKECSSYPNGSNIPSESCRDMRPEHGNYTEQEPGPGHPFKIESLNETFSPGGLITFRISASRDNCFTGIYAQVRAEDREHPVGRFPPRFNPEFLRPTACNNRNRSTITHVQSIKLCDVNLTWRAPNTSRLTSVRLFVTIVESFERFWVQLNSALVPVAPETFTIPNADGTTPRDDSGTTLDSDGDSTDRMSDNQTSEAKETSDPTESPVKTEPILSSTSKYEQSSPPTSKTSPAITRSRSPRSSESMQELDTTEFILPTTDRFIDELTTFFYTEPDDGTTTLQTDYRRSTNEVSSSMMSTEDDDVGKITTTKRFPKPTKEITNPATTKYESLTSSGHIDMTTTSTEKPSTVNNEMSTSSLTTSFPFLSDFLITTGSELSTTMTTTKDVSETTDKVQIGTTYSATSGITVGSTSVRTTEGIATPTLDQTQTENGLMTSSSPLQTLTPSSAETEFLTTEKDSTTPTPITNLGFSISTEATSTDVPETESQSSPARTNATQILTEETISTDIFPTTTDFLSTSQKELSTLNGDELTTIGILTTTNEIVSTVLTTLTEESGTESKEMKSTTQQLDTTTFFSTETISSTHSLSTEAIPSTSSLTTQNVPSTRESTAHTFASTIGHTTQFVPFTNPITTPTIQPTTAGKTVSDSTDVATEAYASTSVKLTSEPFTDRTTLVDIASASSSTQKSTTNKPITRSTAETPELTSEEEYTTEEVETTAEDFTPMDNNTKETVTQTESVTSSTVIKTSVTTPYSASSSTTRTTENPARTTENPARTTENPARTTENTARTTENTARTTENTARTTENKTVSTQNVTNVSGEMSSTPRATTETSSISSTSSTSSTRLTIASTTQGPGMDTTTQMPQIPEATTVLDTRGTEIVMVFEIENYPFNASLADPDSAYYKKLNQRLATAVKNVYSAMENMPDQVGARGFESGSVIAEMSTGYMRNLSDDETTDAVLVMFEHVTNDMFDSSFNVSRFWIIENGMPVTVDLCYGTKCPTGLTCNVSGDQCVQHCSQNPGFCKNGGTCEGYPENATISCMCNDGFEGERCENMKEAIDDIVTLSVILGSVGAVLLILIVILMCGMFFLLRAKPKPLLPTTVGNFTEIPRFPMIPLHRLDNISMNDSVNHDGFDNSSITSDHPVVDNNRGVMFPNLPDLITSASSNIPDWERDVVSNPQRRRRRAVSFNDIREVLEGDDTVSIETFSFGRSYEIQEEDNGQTTYRWFMDLDPSSTPSRDESPT